MIKNIYQELIDSQSDKRKKAIMQVLFANEETISDGYGYYSNTDKSIIKITCEILAALDNLSDAPRDESAKASEDDGR